MGTFVARVTQGDQPGKRAFGARFSSDLSPCRHGALGLGLHTARHPSRALAQDGNQVAGRADWQQAIGCACVPAQCEWIARGPQRGNRMQAAMARRRARRDSQWGVNIIYS